MMGYRLALANANLVVHQIIEHASRRVSSTTQTETDLYFISQIGSHSLSSHRRIVVWLLLQKKRNSFELVVRVLIFQSALHATKTAN